MSVVLEVVLISLYGVACYWLGRFTERQRRKDGVK